MGHRNMIVAIYPDDYTNPADGKCDASSPRWADLLRKAGHEVRWVDVRRPDILDQLKGCDGFMWRHFHSPDHRQIARRLLPVVERELGLAVYPDQNTCWHFDDKVAQSFLLPALGIPMPRTWVWFDRAAAMEWVKTAEFPMVIKQWSGAGASNVRLVRRRAEAEKWIERFFTAGVVRLSDYEAPPIVRCWRRMRTAAKLVLTGRISPWEIHRNYVLFQEFIPNNAFDTRIIVIGKRAFGELRRNRPNDFRASGSGLLSFDPKEIAPDAVRLGFRIARALRLQSVAMDVLRRGNECVVSEVSYTYPSWVPHACPGHWELEGDDLVWKEGQMWPEEAQMEDFLVRLSKRAALQPHRERV